MEVKAMLCLLLLPLSSFADGWVSESEGSFTFEARFEGEPLPADFKSFRVSWTKEALEVTVGLAESDMGDDEMNAILRDPAWFDVERFSTARFLATETNCDESGACLSKGSLELKGVTQDLSVPFEWQEDGDSATLRGEMTLDRTAFDVGSGEWSTGDSIGIDVRVRFDIQLQRSE